MTDLDDDRRSERKLSRGVSTTWPRRLVVVLLLSVMASGIAAADIYKRVDRFGVIHYTDVPTDKRFYRVVPPKRQVDSAVTGSSQKLNANQAREHIGERQTVCGVVASATFASASRGEPTFLNLDRPYPDHVFTVVIWGSDRSKFQEPPELLRGLNVCVTGTIETYKEMPQVVVRDPSALLRTDGQAPATRSKLNTLPPHKNKRPDPSEARTASPSAGRVQRGSASHSSECETGHWLQSKTDDGDVLILENGSVWEVSPVDVITSMLWLPISEIIVCDDKLINADDGESVGARQVR